MSGRVPVLLASVAGLGHHHAVDHHDRPDRHIAALAGSAGLLEGERHGGRVIDGGRVGHRRAPYGRLRRQLAESLQHLSNPPQAFSRLVELTPTKRRARYKL